MSKKKEYIFYKCRDCEIDFLVSRRFNGSIHCPKCSEYFYTEEIMSLWIERPFQYKRPWTSQEDELIQVGKEQGYTEQQIADSLDGRTLRAVARRWSFIRTDREVTV